MRQLPTIIAALLFLSCSTTAAQNPSGGFSFMDKLKKMVGIEKKHTPYYLSVVLEKELSYDKYTLDDVYAYKDTTRLFQFDKITDCLAKTDSLRDNRAGQWGVLKNKSNSNGTPPLVKEYTKNEYRVEVDKYGIDRGQAIPLYLSADTITPERYAYDGSLVRLTDTIGHFITGVLADMRGEYLIPKKYIHAINDTLALNHVVIVDRNNQNISTYEKADSIWKVRSMNPATTGAHHPPLQKPTPLGMFVLQNKLPKMYYYVDGTTDIGGFAPWASRFCEGGYIHGVPVNKPHTEIIEYSSTLGTIPRSHMCVRNASSHAKFIYDNFPIEQTLVYVIE